MFLCQTLAPYGINFETYVLIFLSEYSYIFTTQAFSLKAMHNDDNSFKFFAPVVSYNY